MHLEVCSWGPSRDHREVARVAPAAEAAATMAALGALNEGGVALGDGANGRPNESRQQGVLLIKRRMDTGHSSSRGCGYGGRRAPRNIYISA